MDRTSKATKGRHLQQSGPPFPQGTKWEPAKPRNSFTAEINAYVERHANHVPTTFMRSPRLKKVVFKSKLQQQRRSPNLSCSPDIFQYSVHILSSRCPNDLNVFPGKLRQFPITFISIGGSSSDTSNDILFRQEDKNFYKVKSWPPTQQLVIKSIILNFSI